MQSLIAELLAPVAAALNNIAAAIRESNTVTVPFNPTTVATVDALEAKQTEEPVEAPTPKVKKAKAEKPAPAAPAAEAKPAEPTKTLEELVSFAKEKLSKENGVFDENLPKIKTFLAGAGIAKITETPADNIPQVWAFLATLPSEAGVV